MKHPNHPSVDQSDRVVPYNLRQSGRTPTELLISTRVRKSPFWHLSHEAGCWRATIYNRIYHPRGYVKPEDGGAMVEYDALVNRVTMWNVAVERQIRVKGPDAEAFTDFVITRDATKIEPMHGKYAILCNDKGGILNDPVLLRLSEDEFWFSISDSDLLFWLQGVNVTKKYDVDKIISHRDKGSSIGFGAEVKNTEDKKTGEWMKSLEPEDLLKYGLIPEFIGRLPIIATLEDLDEKSLIKILQEPKNSLIKQYQELFKLEGAKLVFKDNAIKEIAQKAISKKTGARGLRSILESVLLKTMFDLPSMENVNEVIVDSGAAKGQSQPIIVHSKNAQKDKDKDKSKTSAA